MTISRSDKERLKKLVGYATGSLYSLDAAADQIDNIFVPILGEDSCDDIPERFTRFLEEALEGVQAAGMSQEAAHFWVDYVYGRPKGEPAQEFAGIFLTYALCLSRCKSQGILTTSAGKFISDELLRVIDNSDKVAAKQLAKKRVW